MAIYTKTGDRGTTAIFGGKRLLKSSKQIKAFGQIDELTSFIGLLISKDKKNSAFLTRIQKALYDIMSVLSGAKVDIGYLEMEVEKFENEIDKITKRLSSLHRFLLPQGGGLSSLYHITRTVARRAERTVVELFNGGDNKKFPKSDQLLILKFLNRLSDLFFTLARKSSKGHEIVT